MKRRISIHFWCVETEAAIEWLPIMWLCRCVHYLYLYIKMSEIHHDIYIFNSWNVIKTSYVYITLKYYVIIISTIVYRKLTSKYYEHIRLYFYVCIILSSINALFLLLRVVSRKDKLILRVDGIYSYHKTLQYLYVMQVILNIRYVHISLLGFNCMGFCHYICYHLNRRRMFHHPIQSHAVLRWKAGRIITWYTYVVIHSVPNMLSDIYSWHTIDVNICVS